MFNRKKIEWMAEEIRKLRDEVDGLNGMIEALMLAHLSENEIAITEELGAVTFEELAKYVIDKEPIAREVTTTKYFEHPDNCQGSSEDTENELDNN